MSNPALSDLRDLHDWLHDQIDGGLECRGRDTTISSHIDTVERAMDAERKLEAVQREVATLQTTLMRLATEPSTTSAQYIWGHNAGYMKAWNEDRNAGNDVALREVAALREDAERWRFLREHVTYREHETLSSCKVYYRRWFHDTTYKPHARTAPEMFDAAIDAARGKP